MPDKLWLWAFLRVSETRQPLRDDSEQHCTWQLDGTLPTVLTVHAVRTVLTVADIQIDWWDYRPQQRHLATNAEFRSERLDLMGVQDTHKRLRQSTLGIYMRKWEIEIWRRRWALKTQSKLEATQESQAEIKQRSNRYQKCKNWIQIEIQEPWQGRSIIWQSTQTQPHCRRYAESSKQSQRRRDESKTDLKWNLEYHTTTRSWQGGDISQQIYTQDASFRNTSKAAHCAQHTLEHISHNQGDHTYETITYALQHACTDRDISHTRQYEGMTI